MAALDRGLGRQSQRTAPSNNGGDGIPIGETEVAAAESVPSVSVGVDENVGLVLGPARRWGFARSGLERRWRGGGHGRGCRIKTGRAKDREGSGRGRERKKEEEEVVNIVGGTCGCGE